jgi:hypothetical protein
MENILKFTISSFLLLSLVLMSCFTDPKEEKEWQYLFNGNDLSEWGIKIKNHEFGENYNNTFKVDGNVLKVSYEEYQSFEEKFGHIFYMKKKI